MAFLRSWTRAFLTCGVMTLTPACSGSPSPIIGNLPEDGGGGGMHDSGGGGPESDAAIGRDSGSSGGRCTTAADCSGGKICGFKTAEGCPGTGTCLDAPAPDTAQCELYAPGCACDGTEVNLACNGYPGGYASKPVLHSGWCASPPVDAGPGSCASDGDCGGGQLCAFPITGGCSAAGTCFTPPPPGPTCNAFSPACSCSGQTLNVICTIYPNGAAPQPIAHRGACEAGVVLGRDAGGAFACGNSTCDASRVCKIGMGGAAGNPPSYTCVDAPAQCASTRTCACVKSALAAQECTESGDSVTVTFLYP
jgi:hypothetical protein